MIPDALKTDALELLRFAHEAKVRPDWHEPDEQGVEASVVGDHLDNAMGNTIMNEAMNTTLVTGKDTYMLSYSQEFVVEIRGPHILKLRINLASLLAIAAGAAETELGKYAQSGPQGPEDPDWDIDPLFADKD